MPKPSCRLFTLIVMLTPWVSVSDATPGAAPAPPIVRSPLSGVEALPAFHLADDELVIELVAAEPDVVSPVAVSWDEHGRMYVAEMNDYPSGPGTGRIKLLEGFDGPGKTRKTTIYADRLPFPTGTLPWKGSLFVTAAPNLWYLKDTKGTGQADVRRVVLTGFHEGNQQLRVNGLVWGLDNWIYGANGRSDGKVRRPNDPLDSAVAMNRRDFRFHPQTGAVEAIAGPSQFGLARDDWGNRFLSWNTNPIRHVVLEQSYLSRNPWLASGRSVGDMIAPTDLRVYSISPRPTTFNNESVTSFNASCGITIYRGDLLGRKYQGNAFICEPLTNLIQRRILKPAGPTFVAERGEKGQEFLASTDPWFHPVNLATGPDGALYLVDFYREWVEHPGFVPKNIREKIDWRNGASHGRIWRIRPKNTPVTPWPALGRADLGQLMRELDHANGWRRDTAQRLLVERHDPKAVPLLKKKLREQQSPLFRIHALWALQSFQALDEETLERALRDESPRVREQALRLCEGRLAGSSLLRKTVRRLSVDGDARVRFQCALALGGTHGPEELKALVRIAAADGENDWARLAIVSGLSETAVGSLAQLIEVEPKWLSEPSSGQLQVLRQIFAIVGARNRDPELAAYLGLLRQPGGDMRPRDQLVLLAGLMDGISHSPRSGRVLIARPPAPLERSVRGLDGLLHFALETAVSEKAQAAQRTLAIDILAQAQPQVASKVLIDLLLPRQPVFLQKAAARNLVVIGDSQLAARTLQGWPNYTISTRQEILRALSGSQLVSSLLSSLERKDIMAVELDPTIRSRLRRIRDKKFQSRLDKLLGSPSLDRAAVVTRYRTALQELEKERRQSDPEAGARLFVKHCLTCHQMQGHGHRVGPDLVGIGSRPYEALIEDILDPSKTLTPDFRDFVLFTKDGRVFSGLLAAETATSVTLRRAEGREDTVLRTEIEDFRTTGKSLMPDGMEQTLSPRDLADLLAYLKRAASVKLQP